MDRPIKPSEVASSKAKVFPSYVFEAFNELITAGFTCGRATVKQNVVIDRIIALSDNSISRQEIFDKGYLNVEEVYREQGWKVEYDKPCYDENYEAYFTFKER